MEKESRLPLRQKIKAGAFSTIKFVFRNVFAGAILVVGAGLTIWAYAAFVEPSAGPASSDQDFAQNILGADNADNDFSSSSVTANDDGSIVERLESLLGKLAGTTDIGGATGSITGSVPEMIDAVYDKDESPSGWTCTLRTGTTGGTSTASCVGDEKVITGGCAGVWYNYSDNLLMTSRPTSQGWYCSTYEDYSEEVTAYANCCL